MMIKVRCSTATCSNKYGYVFNNKMFNTILLLSSALYRSRCRNGCLHKRLQNSDTTEQLNFVILQKQSTKPYKNQFDTESQWPINKTYISRLRSPPRAPFHRCTPRQHPLHSTHLPSTDRTEFELATETS